MTPEAPFSERLVFANYRLFWAWLVGCVVLGLLGELFGPTRAAGSPRRTTVQTLLGYVAFTGVAVLFSRLEFRKTVVGAAGIIIKRIGYRATHLGPGEIVAWTAAPNRWLLGSTSAVEILTNQGRRLSIPTRKSADLLDALSAAKGGV